MVAGTGDFLKEVMNFSFIDKLVACFELIPGQIFWGITLGVLMYVAGYAIYKLDRGRNEFVFVRIFMDPVTGYPIFTNVVMFIVLFFSIWLSAVLMYHEQWKLAVEAMQSIITAFVVKYGLASLQNWVQGKYVPPSCPLAQETPPNNGEEK